MSSFSIFPSSWEIRDLRDVPIAIIDGDRGKNYPAKEEFSPEGFCLFLNTGNIRNDSFDFTNCDFITENKSARLRKGKLLRNDIVLTTRGTVGSIGYFHQGIKYDHIRINSGMVIFRCSSSLSPPYFYQLFKSQTLKTQFELYSSGSAQPQLPIKDLRRVKLPIPKQATQQKIAAILSTYDELIEINNRRVALLEKLAEEIYREWFVRRRFPGNENVKKFKGVPDGWEVRKLGSVLELCYGKALKDGDRVSGEYPVYGSSGIVGTHNEALVKTSGLIVGRKGNVGSVYWSDSGFFPIDTVYFVKSNLPNSFLYFLLRTMNFIDNDSAVPGLNRSQAYSNQFFLPPVALIKKYAEIADSQFKIKRILTGQTEKLTAIRDQLMLRLISGKLSVENLNIEFPPDLAEELETEPTVAAYA